MSRSEYSVVGTGLRYLGAWTVLVVVGVSLVAARRLAVWRDAREARAEHRRR